MLGSILISDLAIRVGLAGAQSLLLSWRCSTGAGGGKFKVDLFGGGKVSVLHNRSIRNAAVGPGYGYVVAKS